jgi:hypothetical protein
MTDIESMPATPPWDPEGDERAGYAAAGGLLVALGWGLGVAANLLLHVYAPGFALGSVRIGGRLGPYAWGVFGLGLFAGALGVVLLAYARHAPKGRVVLPGYPYD